MWLLIRFYNYVFGKLFFNFSQMREIELPTPREIKSLNSNSTNQKLNIRKKHLTNNFGFSKK